MRCEANRHRSTIAQISSAAFDTRKIRRRTSPLIFLTSLAQKEAVRYQRSEIILVFESTLLHKSSQVITNHHIPSKL
ncbi:hypothetical protein ACHAWO_012933 [Cyclotella atomus]|uniref:Uncharacterized protein n=1 Tax=Cyclotella atomus TaxID=382360 RepID=A0ABD3NUB9_9STRA